MYFDTHAHYDDARFDEDREQLLTELGGNLAGTLGEAGFRADRPYTIINSGASMEGCRDAIALAHQYDFMYASVGLYPEYAHEMNDAIRAELNQMAEDPRVLAIGEIGLDYHVEELYKEAQHSVFLEQMDLARAHHLPIVIHSRDAAADTLMLMKEGHAEEIGGDMHCYSYSKELARDILNMGFYLGIGGVLTFKNGRKLREVVEYAPMEQLLLETDCPYLAPVPNRGSRNDSRNLRYVVAELARIKGLTTERVLEITEENARRCFGV